MGTSQTDDLPAVVLGIAALAQLGALLRLELGGAFAGANAATLSSTMWANMLGCLVIGLLNGLKPSLDRRGLSPLFYALSAGFCGALTTFSTWQSEVARWLVRWPNAAVLAALRGHGAFGRLLTAASALLTELGVSCLAFQVGRGVAHLATDPPAPRPPADSDEEKADEEKAEEAQPLMTRHGTAPAAVYGSGGGRPEPSGPGPLQRVQSSLVAPVQLVLGRKAFTRSSVLTPCGYMHGSASTRFGIAQEDLQTPTWHPFALVFFLLLCLVTALVTALTSSHGGGHELFFIVVWAPPGALLRYALGLRLNSNPPGAGTFLANVAACAVLGAVTASNAARGCYAGDRWRQGLMTGITTGFCGSLSTTSTFVAHLHEFSFGEALVYFVVSVAAAQGVLCAILGGYLSSSMAGGVCA